MYGPPLRVDCSVLAGRRALISVHRTEPTKYPYASRHEEAVPWYRRLVALAELAGDHDQKDIAERLGVSADAVSGWKTGTEPRPDAVRAAAKAYHDFVNADTDELLIELLKIAYVPDHGNGSRRSARRTSADRPQQF
jgi:hypothetical protein